MEFEYIDDERQAAEARVGQTLCGRWKLEQLLGMGGMAAVYAARADDEKPVALKVLHAHLGHRKDIRERFLREGLTANQVQHPGVVRVHDHQVDTDGTAVLVMELLDGESLAQRHKRQELSLAELLDYLEQVLDALVVAHGQGIVHRDLKPDNLFLTRDAKVKILDFGIARVLDDIPGQKHTKTGMTLGTVPFMAPEQALGKRDQIDWRVDLFALGAMAFRILAGRNIHEADNPTEQLVAMATKPAPRLSSVAPGVPHDVCMVVDLALAFAKEARYPDAPTMRDDVRALRLARTPSYVAGLMSQREEATRVELVAPKAVAAPSSVAPSAADPATLVAAPSQRLLGLTRGPEYEAPVTVVGEPDRALLVEAGNAAAMDPTTASAPDAALLALASGRDPVLLARAAEHVTGDSTAAGNLTSNERSRRLRVGLGVALLTVMGLGGVAFAIGRSSDSMSEREPPLKREAVAEDGPTGDGEPGAAPQLATPEHPTIAGMPSTGSKAPPHESTRTQRETKHAAPTTLDLSEPRSVSGEPLDEDRTEPRASESEPKQETQAKEQRPAVTQHQPAAMNTPSETRDEQTVAREKQAVAREKVREKHRRGDRKRRPER